MASLESSDLCASELNLSVDSENCLDELEELNESDLATINGGFFVEIIIAYNIGYFILTAPKAY
jgi:bacteriocin-like protein